MGKQPQTTRIQEASPSIYSSLDRSLHEFRLLVLKPGTHDKPLHATLKRVRFPHAGKRKGTSAFETISYVWGDQSVRDSITVNGQLLDIPASAASALRRMRFRHGERSLWIDSVCINQGDLLERGQQVSMMSEIYFCAFANLIHLGEDDVHAESAFGSIERIVQEAREESAGTNLDDFIFYADQRVKHSTSPLRCMPDIEALAWLFSRHWFRYVSLPAESTSHTEICSSRLWVVQELLLSARSIAYCGEVSIAMSKILTATGWLQHKLLHLPQRISSDGFWGASKMFMMQTSGHDLTDLLMHLGFYHCSDVRDKVFGGLGLFQQRNETVKGFYGMPDALSPDYTKEPVHVLRDASRLCIDNDQSLLLLANSHYRRQGRLKGMPTWVPDWHRKWSSDEAATYQHQSFNACGHLVGPDIKQHPDPNILSLRASTSR